MSIPTDMENWHTTVDKSGRVLLPAPLRKALGVDPGTEVVWTKTEDGVKLQHFQQVLSTIQDYFKSLSPPEVIWSEELIAERRLEAENE